MHSPIKRQKQTGEKAPPPRKERPPAKREAVAMQLLIPIERRLIPALPQARSRTPEVRASQFLTHQESHKAPAENDEKCRRAKLFGIFTFKRIICGYLCGISSLIRSYTGNMVVILVKIYSLRYTIHSILRSNLNRLQIDTCTAEQISLS